MSADSSRSAATDLPDEQRRVQVSRAALRTIQTEVVRAGILLETGGILLGHDTGGAGDVPRVSVAGGPGPNAVREPMRFSRDREHATRLAEQAWQDQQAVWLGEWHTHPGGSPVPSEIDMASYVRHLADPELGFDRFVAIIVALPVVGVEPTPTASDMPGKAVLIAWVVEQDGARIAELTILEEKHDG